MRSALDARAELSRRSTNSEIVDILSAALEGKPADTSQIPASALTALTYQITRLETELLTREADLAAAVDTMTTLASALPLEAHADARVKIALKEAARTAKRFRRTPEQKAAADAEHRAKFKQTIVLMEEVLGIKAKWADRPEDGKSTPDQD